jgi:hypothetical protein
MSLTKEKSFTAGYVLAVANIVHTHDEPVIAEDVLRELGILEPELDGLDLTDFDLEVLRPLFRSIEAKKG